MGSRRLRGAMLAAAVVVGFLALPGTAYGATLVPCSPSSLQSAITSAPSGATLALASGCVYNYTDATASTSDSALPHITKTLTISGNHATIQRDPVASTPFRVLTVDPPGSLTLSNLTIEHGKSLEGGGVLISASGATLKASGVTVKSNVAVNGGGIEDLGTLSFSGGSINGNTVGFCGGGLWVTGAATLRNTSVSDNLADDVVGNGFACGGGVTIEDPSTVTLANSHVDNNTASAHNGNFAQGGGIENDDNSGTVTMSSSTVQFNRAYGDGQGSFGGGIINFGPLKVSSSHLDYNTASDATGQVRGGGIVNSAGAATIQSSTVTQNQATGANADGGGIFRQAGTVTIPNTAVANNDPNNCGNPSTVTGCT